MKKINENQHVLPWYKEYYVWFIIFFPMLAVIGGIITVIMAVQTNDGLVVDDYYKQGLEINRTLERDQTAMTYQLDAKIKIDDELEDVSIKITSAENYVLPTNINVKFLHSTRSGMDKEMILALTDEQDYRGKLERLALGKWYVHIEHNDWRLIKIITVH